MASLKIKRQKKDKEISKNELNQYNPTHIKFNLSFMTKNSDYCFENKNITKDYYAQLLKRMYELSNEDYREIMLRKKERGFEDLEASDLKNPQSLVANFSGNGKLEHCTNKFFIFRLYPNNNPVPARIVGKFIDTTFYVLGISLKHDKIYK